MLDTKSKTAGHVLLAPPLTQDTVGIESQNVSTLSSAHVIEEASETTRRSASV